MSAQGKHGEAGPSEYWRACAQEGLDRAGIQATPEQVVKLARCMESAADMCGEATGRGCIPHPAETELRDTKRRHEAEQRATEIRLRDAEHAAIRLAGGHPETHHVEHSPWGARVKEDMR